MYLHHPVLILFLSNFAVLAISESPLQVLKGAYYPYQQCATITRAQFCDSGTAQELVDMLYCCNSSQYAISEGINECRYNSKGEYCDSRYTSSLLHNVSSVCMGSTDPCSPECKDCLTDARDELDCCINGLKFSMDVDTSSISPLDDSLWEKCNVARNDETCPSSVTKPKKFLVQPSCSGLSPMEIAYPYLCKQSYRLPLRKQLLSTEGCQHYERDKLASCAVNQFGEYCETLDSMDTKIEAASANCQNVDGAMCTSPCKETLEGLLSHFGCCINELYNHCSNDYRWLEYDFWQKCDLEIPGCCEEKLTGCGNPPHTPCSNAAASLHGKASNVIKTASIAAILLLAVLLE